jgi:hypothetical protein
LTNQAKSAAPFIENRVFNEWGPLSGEIGSRHSHT